MSYNYKPIYYDTDSAPYNTGVVLGRRNAKAMLNAVYGAYHNGTSHACIDKYCEADVIATKEAFEQLNKENKNMNREYIVVHSISKERTAIVFKDAISAVLQSDTVGKTEIVVSERSIFVSDSYADIVKQLFK